MAVKIEQKKYGDEYPDVLIITAGDLSDPAPPSFEIDLTPVGKSKDLHFLLALRAQARQ